MTKTNMDLSELLAKHDQGDFLRGIAEAVLQLIMETDVEGIIGAGRHERSGERTTCWRKFPRMKRWPPSQEYDARRCHTAIIEHGSDAVIPIRRNSRAWKED